MATKRSPKRGSHTRKQYLTPYFQNLFEKRIAENNLANSTLDLCITEQNACLEKFLAACNSVSDPRNFNRLKTSPGDLLMVAKALKETSKMLGKPVPVAVRRGLRKLGLNPRQLARSNRKLKLRGTRIPLDVKMGLKALGFPRSGQPITRRKV